MVEVRIVLVVDVFIIILSLGATWLTVGNPQAGSSLEYNSFGVASMVGGYVGGQQASPPGYTQSDYNSYVQSVLPPFILGNWELDLAISGLVAAFILAFVSFKKWELSLPSGILQVLGVYFWIEGLSAISQAAGGRLAQWPGFNSGALQIPLSSSSGPYIGLVGGAALLITYIMTKVEKFDTPLDTSLPSSGNSPTTRVSAQSNSNLVPQRTLSRSS